MLRLDHDMHIHSTFSDGKNTPLENLEAAQARGLSRMCMVDHVRESTDWLPSFLRCVDTLRATTDMEVEAGVEVKLLNEDGRLDLPVGVPDHVRVYIADHRFPLGDTCLGPREVHRRLEAGELTAVRAFEALFGATRRAIERTPTPVIAHLMSIVPRVGLDPAAAPAEALRALARVAAQRGAELEIDERWRCPSADVARVFAEEGVKVVASTDSHRASTIGAYDFVTDVAEALA